MRMSGSKKLKIFFSSPLPKKKKKITCPLNEYGESQLNGTCSM